MANETKENKARVKTETKTETGKKHHMAWRIENNEENEEIGYGVGDKCPSPNFE